MTPQVPTNIFVIVDEPADWPLDIPGASDLAARAYLTDPFYANGVGSSSGQAASRSFKIFNLCKSYRYQSSGYYVSLLAEARGHKPLPKVGTMEDLQSQNLVRYLTEDLSPSIQEVLVSGKADDLSLGIYFGHCLETRYDSLSQQLFERLQAPLLSARFQRHDNQWVLRSVHAMTPGDIPEDHREFAIQAASAYFSRPDRETKKFRPRFDLAILLDPNNSEPPSNAMALEKFRKAAEDL